MSEGNPSDPNAAVPRLRFPRRARVRLQREYAHVYRAGGRARGRFILVVAAASLNPPPKGPEPRLGLSVGRKYHRHAVKRNRARRVLREAFRLARPHLPALDYILIPQMGQMDWNAQEVARELQKLAAKAQRKYEVKCAAS